MLVLIVEDSQVMRLLLANALRTIDGVEIVDATDGADALVKLDARPPDLVLTDLNMPVMDGFALIEEIRKRPALADLPVIVLTTEGAIPDQARASELAVAAYATKPIRTAAIVETVRRVLDGRR
jgi:CheY-like chemotaxis protein